MNLLISNYNKTTYLQPRLTVSQLQLIKYCGDNGVLKAGFCFKAKPSTTAPAANALKIPITNLFRRVESEKLTSSCRILIDYGLAEFELNANRRLLDQLHTQLRQ